MTRHLPHRSLAAAAAVLASLPLAVSVADATATAASADPGAGPLRVLVFSRTAAFRHDSIPDGVAMIRQLGRHNGFAVDATEDPGAFTVDNLRRYGTVVWLSTTGDVLDDAQQAAFERYIESGGGFVGIHAAADTEYGWPWYGGLVGARFRNHPEIQQAQVLVTDRVHPSTKDLPLRWTRTDEWYNYQTNPTGSVHVLAYLDEKSYHGGEMGVDHPIAWCHDFDGGRAWYTGGGHTRASYSDPAFQRHVLGGILTTAGRLPSDCGATVDGSFQQVTLAKGAAQTGEPMGLAVLPDRSVLHTSRDGTVFHTTADGRTSVAARIPVYNFREDGLQGIAIDPDFERNHWVYVDYAPPLDTPPGEVPHNSDDPTVWDAYKGFDQLSRFRFVDGRLDLASEQRILRIPQDRGNCCHHGGDIDFDADGNLYLSVGDDSDPFESNGYAPIDDRVTRAPQFDARRSAGNTNDLRGKLLRIRVMPNGSYRIPKGNLFPPGTPKTRPEIYAMGFRNPFRFSVDRKTGTVWLGDYGPDAPTPGPRPDYGPGGQVEFNRITSAGNFGWPFCTGRNTPAETYAQRQFTSTYTPEDPNDGLSDPVGPKFDCANGPTNTSRLNTGLSRLPAPQPAWLPYDGNSVPEFDSGSESPMGGPVYRFDPDLKSDTKFPAYYDGTFFPYEWGRHWIRNIVLDREGNPLKIDKFFASMQLANPMDVEFGPDGAMYVLDYGTGFFTGTPESAVYRIDYHPRPNVPCAATAPEAGYTSLFDGTSASLAGWRQAGPGGFDLSDCVVRSRDGLGLFWYAARSFPNNYRLRLDWKVAGDDNSGVFVGFPASDDPWSAVNRGYEVQIDMTDTPSHTTGAIYDFQAADLAARDAALRPPGQWNTYEIVVQDDTITVVLNGVRINRFVSQDPDRMVPPGFVGVQNHGLGDDVFFRNIRIRQLA
jgi:cytochrome c